jgi:hypothetical protein
MAEIVEERVAQLTGRTVHVPDGDLEAVRTVGDTVAAVLNRL